RMAPSKQPRSARWVRRESPSSTSFVAGANKAPVRSRNSRRDAMSLRWSATLLAFAATTLPAAAQDAVKFRWQAGQTLSYRVKHVTKVVEVIDGKKYTSGSDL